MPEDGVPDARVSRFAGRVHAFDAAVEARLEPLRNAALDRFFYSLSSAADHGLIWAVIGAGRAARRRDSKVLRRLTTAMSVESGLTNGVVKSLFGRLRPQEHFANDDPLPYGMRRPITSSFPSGHAATGFMVATMLADGTDAGPAYFSLAALVAFSRVYVRMHHTSDIVAGAVLGLALGQVAKRILPIGPGAGTGRR